MALYSDKVMDHFQHPRNVGKIDDADGIGEVGNAKCGDIMRMYIKVKDDVITDCKFNTAVKDYYDKNGIAYDPEKFQIHDCEHCHDE